MASFPFFGHCNDRGNSYVGEIMSLEESLTYSFVIFSENIPENEALLIRVANV